MHGHIDRPGTLITILRYSHIAGMKNRPVAQNAIP